MNTGDPLDVALSGFLATAPPASNESNMSR